MTRALSAAGVALALACQDSDRPVSPYPATSRTTAAGSGGLPAPSNLSAVASSPSQINLSWTDNSPNENGFQVYRSPTGSPGTFAVVATVGVNVQTVSDNGLTALTQECYQVRAIRVGRSGTSYSGFSNTACATTLAPPIPGAVWGAYNSESSGGTAILTWVDNSTNEDGFRIYRSTEDGVVSNLAGTVGANTTSWLTDQPDCYRVVAFNAGGEAPPSPVACTRPAAPTNLTISIDGVLTWTDNSSIETAYEVWYYWYSPCCGGGACEQAAYEYMVAELPANSTSFGTGYAPVPDCQRDGFYVVAKRGSYSSDAAGVDLP